MRHGYVRSSKGDFTTFDAPGAGTGAGQGTRAYSINPAGTIAGYAQDASDVVHGFLRAPDGTITGFDPTGALFTFPLAINPAGAITGQYCDGTNCRGFLRATDGTMTTFDVSGDVNGTYPYGINPAGAIVGYYIDASNVYHGFLRARDGNFTTFDAPGAGNATDSYQGTLPTADNPSGKITGSYVDPGNLQHGFLRTPKIRRRLTGLRHRHSSRW